VALLGLYVLEQSHFRPLYWLSQSGSPSGCSWRITNQFS